MRLEVWIAAGMLAAAPVGAEAAEDIFRDKTFREALEAEWDFRDGENRAVDDAALLDEMRAAEAETAHRVAFASDPPTRRALLTWVRDTMGPVSISKPGSRSTGVEGLAAGRQMRRPAARASPRAKFDPLRAFRPALAASERPTGPSERTPRVFLC